jgi:fructose-1,6-bisphosphatase/inositol monophosphatase family enzyme
MHRELKRLAIAVGDSLHSAKQGLARGAADNARWKAALKERCLLGIRKGLESQIGPDIALRMIELPYSTQAIGAKGLGKNELCCRLWKDGRRTLTVLVDVLDGTWNATAGLPWSSSTMLALTDIQEQPAPPQDLLLSDFKCALISPLAGGLAAPAEPPGFYYGVVGEPPRFRLAASTVESMLSPTVVDDCRQTRFFLDLFTTESYESHAISIDAVKPLLYEWADFGRFYGTGMEMMALLGIPGTTPGFGGYVAANQKADNLIPTKMLLEGAGMIVTNWWAEPIDSMRITDRAYVAIAANQPLHQNLVRHLSRIARLP